ncbi:ComEC/Rec2 family competence protein [Priestia megaterium]|uniref:ComEC/Rec2 family competence protein n=1 Tax=Priestia megaterium TaxID=1404 RepID=UPI000BF9A464|nr:ComEC/Rec2 family competence protein [Priestia megaterium]MBZ5483104.1 MBL fold metallo-hydrolase [Bacillus sp. T_4]PET66181.1 MBL fold metallo-hydrolase [Priestia megaterium]PFK84101.1 MBL fold metallo-hydrolase [Priestia megaterium]
MKIRVFKIVSSLAIGIGIAVAPASSYAATPKTMKVHYIDVGQGDSIYIKAPNGEDILIDGGNKGKGNAVVSYLKKQKVDDIEVLISTHPDADHIGGLDEVINASKVENVYAPKVGNNTQAYKDFLNAVKKKKLTIKTAQASVKLPVKDVNAQIVGPTKTYANSDLNDWSAVVHMIYKKNTFLFTGDAETKAEAEADMIKAKKTLRADVLKVGHHGAKTSTSKNFLDAVKPKYAVISVGKNSYGHPTSQVVNLLKNSKASILRTDQSGTISITGDGTSYSVEKSR